MMNFDRLAVFEEIEKSKRKKNSFSENSQTVKIDLKVTFLDQI